MAEITKMINNVTKMLEMIMWFDWIYYTDVIKRLQMKISMFALYSCGEGMGREGKRRDMLMRNERTLK